MSNDSQTPLGALVTAGDQQTEAQRITDTIFMVKDISNAYLVTTADGALPEQLETGTQAIAGAGFRDTWDYFNELGPFLNRRSGKLWASMTRREGPPPTPPRVVPDIEVADRHAFEQDGRRIEVLKTPGGETLCSVFVWLPEERTVFTGNLFGPVWRAMPNLVTMRGDKPRLVRPHLRSVEQVRALAPELPITGHGEPIRGVARIRADLDTLHAAVSWIERQTIAGMNAGKDVHTLMREIVLPQELKIGEFHGKTPWVVRAIWEENGGWFHYDSTTSLYGVPRSSVDTDLAELAGGAGLGLS